jgi:ATP-binding cassette subfamily F protein uup
VKEKAKRAALALNPGPAKATTAPASPKAAPARKLTNKERKELEELPAQIEAFETEQAKLGAKLADPVFYQRERSAAAEVKARLDVLERQHAIAFARWEELEAARPKG